MSATTVSRPTEDAAIQNVMIDEFVEEAADRPPLDILLVWTHLHCRKIQLQELAQELGVNRSALTMRINRLFQRIQA